MSHEIIWLAEPEEHDYPAAESYLSLKFDPSRALQLIGALREAHIQHIKAKDILRASGLAPLPATNKHVRHNRKKIREGKALSPILLVRGEPTLIADGYHRVCAVYRHDEDAPIPCKLV
ncbi:Uncharacterised protein [Burkholderia pseudomallei]|uniref:hypothetical protein n=1 Tax=Burkholderia pseudomallei TaxID=28450 RepID=UPI0005DA983D|nr:hypothetical protein [Burkholderia pseudomallei]MCW0102606.1 hypothetical protein [Burkholderia pseudomallei]MCW0132678.1 hypothetical protein [Burkholderia pseudomallei]CAJ2907951.1 Uncharacterised protein [Burkholderia pseudomallei]CAJ9873341.1 Uncharacterised protein [Burkholderia pseudomallei]CAK1305606.1 Uncharacterised protein [Burkholderia pseudomallei]